LCAGMENNPFSGIRINPAIWEWSRSPGLNGGFDVSPCSREVSTRPVAISHGVPKKRGRCGRFRPHSPPQRPTRPRTGPTCRVALPGRAAGRHHPGASVRRGVGHRSEFSYVLLIRHRLRGWVPPRGRDEAGETPRETASRELLEEAAFQEICSLCQPLPVSAPTVRTGHPRSGSHSPRSSIAAFRWVERRVSRPPGSVWEATGRESSRSTASGFADMSSGSHGLILFGPA
jgi:8-oxo-dGTP pyrophosphatase MutT (NUDIX family)